MKESAGRSRVVLFIDFYLCTNFLRRVFHLDSAGSFSRILILLALGLVCLQFETEVSEHAAR